MIYQFIQTLITKNTIPDDDADDIDEQFEDDEFIPERYKCALTKTIMSDPVMCGHNNKVFERDAIYEFIFVNGRLPMVTAGAEDQIIMDDEASFLLFEDASLKIEIAQFKQQHNV